MRLTDNARIGVIGPSGNQALELELPPHMPKGWRVHHTRVGLTGNGPLTAEFLRAMGEQALDAAGHVMETRPAAILFGCTSGSFIDGPGSEAAIADRITAEYDVPAVTTATAVIEALKHFGAQSVFMITPYPDAINAVEVAYLEHYGFTLTGWDSFRCEDRKKIGEIDSEDTIRMVEANAEAVAKADAIFLSCTNLLSFDIIERLEERFGKPVTSSNHASLWAVLNRAGAPLDGAGVGRLFAA